MRVVLISTYELGHQPLHVASPAAALQRAGHEVRCLDLSVQPWDADTLAWAQAIGFSVPMHTAMRLALSAARRVRREHPRRPICFYGLYAAVSHELVIGEYADRVIAGEYEPALVAWIDRLTRTEALPEASEQPIIGLARGTFDPPARELLPGLEHYARLAIGGQERLVGYVEASHGCVHRCRHCPVPVIYDGRIRIVQADTVLSDIESLVGMGAAHITFGDPDFLNGKRHSLAIVRALHERFPTLTFDVTTKVEHVLEHADVWGEMAASGCLFVVSALECVNDQILARLDKGHSTAEAVLAIVLLREHGIEIRPSFMPFTPWTTPRDVLDIVEFVAAHDMVANVDPVQYTIRLLVPEGSLLLERADLREHLGHYDADRLSYPWRSVDPSADYLQGVLSALVQQSVAAEQPIGAVFARVRAEVREAAGEPPAELLEDQAIAIGSTERRARLTEPWFCCAEPTENQFGPLET
ncbi:MAG: CUAEP/CCAEP-tail radical SAM (seleno)protein [Solirubrobacteraceae bacterium]